MAGLGGSDRDSPVSVGGATVETPSLVSRGTPAPRGSGRGRARSAGAFRGGMPMVGLSNRGDARYEVGLEGGVFGRGRSTRDCPALDFAPSHSGAAVAYPGPRWRLGGTLLSDNLEWQGRTTGVEDDRRRPLDGEVVSGAWRSTPPVLEPAWPYASEIRPPYNIDQSGQRGLALWPGVDDNLCQSQARLPDPSSVVPTDWRDYRGPVGRPGVDGSFQRPGDQRNSRVEDERDFTVVSYNICDIIQ